ncbi:hypothetical protein K435DRAFT_849321 [Dendrothele bispora CBS 962.96]|uniref:Uncharacterized protein n=1 Tax=Dendrothele bispora (strain CBS 962.96) TaxID=1314807 RepID=A0A4S8MSS9_DENBC|nr:hypothetical protein K435DRAFT_849321 [Dendrothele bispora CBS 962.96]
MSRDLTLDLCHSRPSTAVNHSFGLFTHILSFAKIYALPRLGVKDFSLENAWSNAFTLKGSNSNQIEPSLADNLSVSVALRSGNIGSSPTRFFLTNASTVDKPGPERSMDVFYLSMKDGLGVFQGIFTNAHEMLDTLPLVGQTTANQVLLFRFSPPLGPDSHFLPETRLHFGSAWFLNMSLLPSSSPNFTLIVAEAYTSTPTLHNKQTA